MVYIHICVCFLLKMQTCEIGTLLVSSSVFPSLFVPINTINYETRLVSFTSSTLRLISLLLLHYYYYYYYYSTTTTTTAAAATTHLID